MDGLDNIDAPILPENKNDNEQNDNKSDISSVKSLKRNFQCIQCGEEILYGLTFLED